MDEVTDLSRGTDRDNQAHWNSTYERRGTSGVSWYQPEPVVSLDLIAETGVVRDAAVIDVGGGASPLVDRLVADGFSDVSVLDISPIAVEMARGRLPADAPVDWVVSDVLSWRPARRYSLWHDRAVFHFLVSPGDSETYRRTLAAALVPGGFVVIGTFAADGPDSCSGLPVARYSDAELASALGNRFNPVAFRREVHRTPSGGNQPFTWMAAKLSG